MPKAAIFNISLLEVMLPYVYCALSIFCLCHSVIIFFKCNIYIYIYKYVMYMLTSLMCHLIRKNFSGKSALVSYFYLRVLPSRSWERFVD